jgi:hypothetical protein
VAVDSPSNVDEFALLDAWWHAANHDNIHVCGYQEESTTTTPFDMVVRNHLDRFHLVSDVIDRLPRFVYLAVYAKQAVRDKLIEHEAYIRRHGDDMPEIREWRWSPTERLGSNLGCSISRSGCPDDMNAVRASTRMMQRCRKNQPPSGRVDHSLHRLACARSAALLVALPARRELGGGARQHRGLTIALRGAPDWEMANPASFGERACTPVHLTRHFEMVK